MFKFSIVVPIYNVEKYIGKLIESLENQTLKDVEIILVDDGSPDSSGSICDKYAETDNRIKVIHKPNGGVSAARNDGMKVATGEYIMFCDSDDWLPIDALEKLYNEGVRTGADIVIGDVIQTFTNDTEKRFRFYEHNFVTEDKDFVTKMIAADFHPSYCPMPALEGPAFGYGGPWNKAVRLSMLREKGIEFDVRVKGIFDDILYTAHILANAKKIAYIQDPVYYYRIIPTSITRTYKANVLEINDAIFNSWNEFIAKYGTTTKWEKPYAAMVIRRLDDAIRLFIASLRNESSIPDRIKVLKNLVNQQPYANAINQVEASRMIKRHRILIVLLRLGLPSIAFYFYYYNAKRKK